MKWPLQIALSVAVIVCIATKWIASRRVRSCVLGCVPLGACTAVNIKAGDLRSSKWWIEKNTPVALNVQAAVDLRILVKVMVRRGFDIENGEDWRGILIAAYGEARTNHDFYVTKGKSKIYLVPDEQKIPSFDDDADLVTMTPFRVANNPTIYFADDHFIKGVDGPLRAVIPDLE
jgi:hypothetical protein